LLQGAYQSHKPGVAPSGNTKIALITCIGLIRSSPVSPRLDIGAMSFRQQGVEHSPPWRQHS
jgi:hypothetical protein